MLTATTMPSGSSKQNCVIYPAAAIYPPWLGLAAVGNIPSNAGHDK